MNFCNGLENPFNNGNGDPGGSKGRPNKRAQPVDRSRSNSRGSNRSTPVSFIPPPVTITNQFSDLNNDVQEHEVVRTSSMIVEAANSTDRTPIITVLNISIKELTSKIASSLSHVSNSSRYKLTQFGIKVYTSTVDHFKQLRSFLIEQNINFFSHPLREERTKKFTLYGLHDMNTDDVTNLLKDNNISPSNVAKLNIRKRRYDDQTIYLLYFPFSSNMTIEKLRTVKYIEHVVVRFEEYSIHKTGVTQCANCLNFSHGARNCYLPPRCIKCGESHKSSVCNKNLQPNDPKSKIPKSLVKCANCQGPHTANFSKCPARIKYLEVRELARNQNSKTNRNIRQQNHNSNAQQFSSNRKSILSSNSWAKTVQRSISNDLFSPTECYEIFKTFMNEISKCKSKLEQINVIARLSMEFLSNHVSP